MQPENFNLLIPQGTDYALTLSFNEGSNLRTPGAKAGSESIPLTSPLPTALLSGDKVSFQKGAIATLSAAASLGARSLTVSPLLFDIDRETGRKVIDLTGYTAAAKIYRDLTQAAISTFTTDLTTAPTDGQLIIKLTDEQTAALPANLAAGNFPTEAEVQAWKSTGAEYIWQLELTDPDSLILRPLEGLVLVSLEGA
ncbi:MAG: hypothetical protein AAF773_03765 [Cyanobacteria bacterium P01_D01_bin.115]